MVKLIVKRLIILSVVTASLYACLPDRGVGRFAKQTIELIKLALVLMPIMEAIT